MKKTTFKRLLPALLITSLPLSYMSSAQADSGWYTKSALLNSELSDTSLDSSGREVDARFDDEIAFSGALGYEWEGGLQLEAEYLTTENDANSLDFNGNNFPTNGTLSGGIETQSVFFNINKGFNNSSAVTPYIGAGIGYTKVESNLAYGPVANITDSDNVLSYQVRAGVDIALSEKLSGFIEYRNITIDDVNLDRFGGGPGGVQTTTQNGDLEINGFALGLKYQF